MHLFRLECAGFEGPITFNIKRVHNEFADIKFYLSLNIHKEPNATDCMKKVEV